MRVLVCGGRKFHDASWMWSVLDSAHAASPITEVISGGAPGADTLGAAWAAERDIPCRVFMADWDSLGRAAGPMRNQKMLDEGKPELVIAFPGGKGTSDMVRRAREAGVPVEIAGF